VLQRSRAVDLGDDERDAGLQPVRRGLVDGDCTAADGVGNERARGGRADGEEREVEVASSTTRSPTCCPAERAEANARTRS
jgi:hypothetical protein